MVTSRKDFTEGNVGSNEIETSAQALRERIEEGIRKASLTSVGTVPISLESSDLPAAVKKVTVEYQAAGWTVERADDYHEKNLVLS